MGLPTRIDRYPAKMIAHLAATLIERYALDATHIVDPFCGSGAVLKAGIGRGKRVTGIDVNPFGALLTGVKLQGFDPQRASALCDTVLAFAKGSPHYPLEWENKGYWFTAATLGKYERIRYVADAMRLDRSRAGRAVLLALGLSVRRCSRSDQRSPKPFISKYARKSRRGRHFDPASAMRSLLDELSALYGTRIAGRGDVYRLDIRRSSSVRRRVPSCSHIITSPPYINAQDYFRNFKLELYLLEGLLPYRVEDIAHRMIGTERGIARSVLNGSGADVRRKLVPELQWLERAKEGQAAIVHRYLQDMERAFCTIRSILRSGGVLVIVCGDNLVGGRRIRTWRVLNEMLKGLGFIQFDAFEDRIRSRALAPKRCGHKGIIKEEIVTAFRIPGTGEGV